MFEQNLEALMKAEMYPVDENIQSESCLATRSPEDNILRPL